MVEISLVAVGHQIILRRLIQIKTVPERLTPSSKEGVRARKARAGNESGIDCGALSYGSRQLEREQTYYSHGFALTSGLVFCVLSDALNRKAEKREWQCSGKL